jgi:xanthine dehydrogenase YagR molybdenum-binding subunit
VIARFLGGGFGSKGRSWWPCVMIAVMAARLVGRPVRLELSRDEDVPHGGLPGGVDPPASPSGPADGRLTALEHHAVARRLGRRRVLRSARPHLADALRLSAVATSPPRPHPRASTPMRPPT